MKFPSSCEKVGFKELKKKIPTHVVIFRFQILQCELYKILLYPYFWYLFSYLQLSIMFRYSKSVSTLFSRNTSKTFVLFSVRSDRIISISLIFTPPKWYRFANMKQFIFFSFTHLSVKAAWSMPQESSLFEAYYVCFVIYWKLKSSVIIFSCSLVRIEFFFRDFFSGFANTFF